MDALSKETYELDQAKFAAQFCARPQNFAWFLGAGASATAGLPTATNILWDMKRRYYCLHDNQDISRQDLQSESVRNKIQAYMEAKGFPKLWADDEYTTYFEKIFEGDKERQRKYMHAILAEDRATLSVGNRVLGAMMAAGFCRAVFTANFDSVIEKAYAEVSGKSLAAFHLEGSRAANQALNNEEFPVYCKIHGDFRYDSLKNLAPELATQNKELADCLVNAGNRFGFVVSGYSGRDQSVMGLFHRVLSTTNPFPHGLFWTGLKGSTPMPAVLELLEEARKKGVTAHLVPIETFDALLLRLWRNTEGKPEQMDQQVRKVKSASVNIPLPPPGKGQPLVRLNALPVLAWPSRCFELTLNKRLTWDDIANARKASGGQLVITRGPSILCWGLEDLTKKILGKDLVSSKEVDVPADLGSPNNLYVKGFMEELCCKALARGKALLTCVSGSKVYLVADASNDRHYDLQSLKSLVGSVSGYVPGLMTPVTEDHPVSEKVTWAEAARVSVDYRDGKLWLLVEPDIWIEPPRARRLAVDFLDKRRGNRFNKEFNALLDAWVHIVLGTAERNAEVALTPFDEGSGVENPSFTISTRTAYTRRQQG